MRTHYNINVVEDKIGYDSIIVVGWINSIRDHGGVYFIDLRDSSGVVQIVANPKSLSGEEYKKFHALRDEWVIQVSGSVRARGEGLENPNLKTGKVEIAATDVTVLNKAKTLPFQPGDESVGIDIRNKYRYLELRDPDTLQTFINKNKMSNSIRQTLANNDFLEVETPILTKSTPEGARDYLVPSRTQHGSFFALPQSPQLFKQMLMVAGFERYYQFARAFRDEDLRADRQPEFTQIDVEMSFVDEYQVKAIANKVLEASFNSLQIGIDTINDGVRDIVSYLYDIGIDAEIDDYTNLLIPEITYNDAMENFGSDKPDLRFGMELIDVVDVFKGSGFEVFANIAKEPTNRIKALVTKGADTEGGLSKKDIKDLEKFVGQFGAKGLAYFQVKTDDGKLTLKGPLTKFLNYAEMNDIIVAGQLDEGDIIFFGAGPKDTVLDYMGRLRLELGDKLFEKGKLVKTHWAPLWVTDFPLLEKNDEK